jgi:hypothetical protein
VARFAFVFALLIAPWPGLGSLFVSGVGAVATAVADPVFASSSVTLIVRAPREIEAQPEWRAVVDARQDLPDGRVRHAGAIDVRRAGYLQLATFLGLAAAWMPRERKRIVAGTCLAVALVSAVVAIPIVDFLSDAGVVRLGSALAILVALARRALVGAPGMAYALPALIWLAIHRLTFAQSAPIAPIVAKAKI